MRFSTMNQAFWDTPILGNTHMMIAFGTMTWTVKKHDQCVCETSSHSLLLVAEAPHGSNKFFMYVYDIMYIYIWYRYYCMGDELRNLAVGIVFCLSRMIRAHILCMYSKMIHTDSIDTSFLWDLPRLATTEFHGVFLCVEKINVCALYWN